MRCLGIDYGTKRVGIAVSDDDGRMAFPVGVIINGGGHDVLKGIMAKIKKESIDRIIVGLPVGLDNKETNQTKLTRVFITLLKKAVHIPVETENEMLTSRIAAASGMTDEHMDASSAAIILQSYLDKINRK